jgi:hypothetical protein
MLTSCSDSEVAERSQLGTKCDQSRTFASGIILEGHSANLRRALVMPSPLTTLRDGVARVSAAWERMFLGAWLGRELIGGTPTSSQRVTQSVDIPAPGQFWGEPSVTAPRPLARPRGVSINVVRIELSPDEAYVDQRSGLLDRKLFIRLARQNAFPASRVGNRYLAKLADVQRYVEAHRLHPQAAVQAADGGPGIDELDDIRRAAGLRPKGTR